MNLFLDTTNWNLIFYLEKTPQPAVFRRSHLQKLSETALSDLEQFLTAQKVNLDQITDLYLTTGPGSYSGIRTGLTLAKTLKAIAPQTKIHLISSLLFQVGLEPAISILDARGGKVFFAVYREGQLVAGPQVILSTELEKTLTPFLRQGYKLYQNYETLNFPQNFLTLKPYFQQAENVEDIEPLYLKGFL